MGSPTTSNNRVKGLVALGQKSIAYVCRGIYISYNLLKKEVFSLFKILTPIVLLVPLLWSFIRGKKSIHAFIHGCISWPTSFYLVCIGFTFSIYVIIQQLIKNSAANFLFDGQDAFEINSDKHCLELNVRPKKNYQWVDTDERLEKLNEITRKSFAFTAWGTDPERVEIRNKTHYEIHHNCMMLIADDTPEPTNKYSGYTHIVAVNANVWYRKKNGEIKDECFDGNLIVPENINYKNEDPFGIIIFTAAWPTEKGVSEHERIDIGCKLTNAIAFHLDWYCKNVFIHHKIIPVMFVTMSDPVLTYFEEIKTNKTEFSKEGAQIVCFDLINKYAIHQYDKNQKKSE